MYFLSVKRQYSLRMLQFSHRNVTFTDTIGRNRYVNALCTDYYIIIIMVKVDIN